MMLLIYINQTLFSTSQCDAAEAWQVNLQDPATPVAEGILIFYNLITLVMIVVGVFVCWMLYFVIKEYNNKKSVSVFTHSNSLEIVWTILPAIILLLIAVPSFTLLYSLEEQVDPALTIKIIGHQWYWSYEYSDYSTLEHSESLNFDSYMINTSDLTYGSFRLLEVDNRLIVPISTHIRLLVTAADVLHSWAVPSFGVKIDACPGRLSQGTLFVKRPGVYYGQCSEICGVNHGFMPIVVKSVSPTLYINWITNKLELN